MNIAAARMQPLPVRPIDAGTPHTGASATPIRPATTMQPLPFPNHGAHDLVDAIRTAAFERMLVRTGVQQPLPVIDPTV